MQPFKFSYVGGGGGGGSVDREKEEGSREGGEGGYMG